MNFPSQKRLDNDIRRCLLPVFRRSTGDGPVPAPPFRAGVRTIHAGPRPVELASSVQLGEQDPVQRSKAPAQGLVRLGSNGGESNEAAVIAE